MKREDETPGTRRLYAEYQQEIWERTDRMFFWLLVAQWLGGIATALWTTPLAGTGALPHLPLAWKAFFLGGVFSALPVYMAVRHPGSALTRREIAVGQGLLTALLIYLSGSRPEMRAVPFVSLAFLAMYRDPTVLLLASLVTAIGFSTYGIAHLGRGVWFMDTAFVAIEDLLLILAIAKSQGDLLGEARKQAMLDSSRAALEREVAERQRTERLLSLQYVITRVLAGSASLREAAPLVLRIVGENQEWQVGELWEVDEGRQHLGCVDLWHAESYARTDFLAARRAARVAPDEGLPGRVWQRHLPLWVHDIAEEPTMPMAGFSAASVLHGAFAIPLRNGPDVIGVMAFFSLRHPPRQRRPPVDAERARRADRPVHGAQARRAGAARQRGALPLDDRRARRGPDPRRQRRQRAGHQRQLRADPGAIVGGDGLAPVGRDVRRRRRRRGSAGGQQRAAFPRSRCAPASRGRTSFWA